MVTTKAGTAAIDIAGLAELAIAIWRINRRVQRNPQTPESVALACQGASDRVAALGMLVEDLAGHPYDENLRVRVIEHTDAEGAARIAECLSPAVYFFHELIRPAEVIVEGKLHE